MELIVRPHLMSDRETTVRDIELGTTLAEVVDTLHEIDARVRQLHLVVLVNGIIIPRDQWANHAITGQEDKIEVATVLHGGGGKGKQILGLIAMVALTIVSGGIAASLTGSTGLLAGMSYTAVKAGVLLVGSLAINAIFAPPRIQDSTDSQNSGKVSNAYAWGSQNNALRPFGPIMRVYGRHRVRADLAAVPYTTNVGDDTYFHAIYSFGYGPLKLEDFKIGQNPLINFQDYEIVVHESFTDPAQLQIYKQDIWQDAYNAEITNAGAPVTATTRPNIDECIIDVMFVQGLGYVNDKGGVDPIRTRMVVEYQEQGSSFWTPTPITVSSGGYTGPKMTGHFVAPMFNEPYTETPFYALYEGQSALQVADWGGPPPPVGTVIKVGPYSMVLRENATAELAKFTLPLPGRITTDANARVPFTWGGAGSEQGTATGEWIFEDAKRGGFIASVNIKFPYPGTWVVRIRKIDNDYTDPNTQSRYLWKRNLIALKSLKRIPPLNPEVPLSIVELKIKATGQLNGSVEEFSGTATSKLRVWDGTGWTTAETRNPAWIYLDIMTGNANRRAVPDRRIDMDVIKLWAAKCDAINSPFLEPMGTCDIIIDKNYTVWELLQSVGTCGRAAPTMRDNKYSVLIDDNTRSPVQMFTPRNSSNLRSTRSYVDEPHALRVKWIDPASNYQQAEATVYNTGYSEANATKFEEIATFGITRYEQAIRYGRYMLAQGKLRQERFTIETDIENIICTRGDMVLVAHDVIEVGGEASRILAINGNVLTMDMPATLQDGLDPTTIGVRIRTSAAILTGVLNITAYDNDYGTITLAAPPPAGVAVGDLLVFGAKLAVTGSYIVESVVPKNDLAASIHLEEYAPAVYDAEITGVIPDYEPQGGGSYVPTPPTNMTAQVVEFIDDATYPRCDVLISWSPPVGAESMPPHAYRGWSIAPDGSETYLGETFRLSHTDGPIDLWRIGGQPRIYRVRAVYPGGGMSQAAEASVILPSREPTPPPYVETFDVADQATGLRRYDFGFPSLGWPIPALEGVAVRYAQGTITNPVWESMTDVLFPYFTQNGLELSVPRGEGAFTFAARSVDIRGVMSTNAHVIHRTLTLSATEQAEQGPGAADKTPPPTPEGITLAAGIGSVFVTVSNTGYLDGGGHDRMDVYGVVYTGGALPYFEQSQLLGSLFGSAGMVALEPGTTYRLWSKHVAKNGVSSVWPAGGTNGYIITTGQDPTKLLDLLSGEITESHLYQSLNSRINLIDSPADPNYPDRVNSKFNALLDYTNWKIEVEQGARKVADDHLYAQYTVKIDAAGYVVGFGIALEANDGAVTSGFVIRADRFAIGAPDVAWPERPNVGAQGEGNLGPQLPFVVQASPTWINGQYVPAGVYMREAFIVNGTIGSAKIGNAVITTAKIGNLQVGTHNIAQSAVTDIYTTGSLWGLSASMNVEIRAEADGQSRSTVLLWASSGIERIREFDAAGYVTGNRDVEAQVEITTGSVVQAPRMTGVTVGVIPFPVSGTYTVTATRFYTPGPQGTHVDWVEPLDLIVMVSKR